MFFVLLGSTRGATPVTVQGSVFYRARDRQSPCLGFAAPEKRSFRGHCALPCVVDRAWTAVHGLSLAWVEAARIFAQKQPPRGLQNALFPLQGRSGAPVGTFLQLEPSGRVGAEGPR